MIPISILSTSEDCSDVALRQDKMVQFANRALHQSIYSTNIRHLKRNLVRRQCLPRALPSAGAYKATSSGPRWESSSNAEQGLIPPIPSV
jgi:hypothetical protein